MGLTIATLQKWQPGKLDDVVTDLVADKKKLRDLEDDMSAAVPPVDWVGDDATAAKESHGKLYDRAVDLAAQTGAVSTGVDTAHTDIKTAKSNLETALTEAKTHGITVNATTGELTWQAKDDAEDEDLKTKAKGIADDIDTALTKANDADQTLARVLTTALVGGYDADGTLDDPGAVTPTMTDSELATWLLEHPKRGMPLIDGLPQSVQEEVGDQLGVKTTELGKDPDLTESEVNDYNTLVEAYGDNPVVATSQLNRTGPRGLIDLNANLTEQFHGDVPAGLRNELGDLQRNLGGVLDAGTQGLHHEGQDGDANNVSDEWLQTFLQEGRKEHSLSWEETAHGRGGDYERTQTQDAYGYQLLAPYLRNVDNGYFMNTVGTDLLDMETPPKLAEDEYLTLDREGSPGTAGPHEDVFDKIRKSIWENEPGERDVRFDFTQQAADGTPGTRGQDPMDAFLDGLSKNPEATREFLTGPDVDVTFVDGTAEEEIPGPRGGTREVPVLNDHSISQLDYLLTDRSYGDATARSLTDAIDAATHEDPGTPEGRDDVRSILNETIRSLGEDEQMRNQPDGDLRTLTPEQQEELPSHEDWNRINPGLRDGLADVLANHYDSVSETYDQGTDVEPTGKYDLEWNRTHLDKVLTELGRNSSASETIMNAGAEYEITQLKENPTDDATSAGGHRLQDVYEAVGRGQDLGVEQKIDTEIEEHNGKVSLVNKGQSYLTTGLTLSTPNPLTISAAVVSNEIVAPEINDYLRDGETRVELTLEDREQFRDKVALQVLLDAQDAIQDGRDPLNP